MPPPRRSCYLTMKGGVSLPFGATVGGGIITTPDHKTWSLLTERHDPMVRRMIARLTSPEKPVPADDLSLLLAALPQFSIARLANSDGV